MSAPSRQPAPPQLRPRVIARLLAAALLAAAVVTFLAGGAIGRPEPLRVQTPEISVTAPGGWREDRSAADVRLNLRGVRTYGPAAPDRARLTIGVAFIEGEDTLTDTAKVTLGVPLSRRWVKLNGRIAHRYGPADVADLKVVVFAIPVAVERAVTLSCSVPHEAQEFLNTCERVVNTARLRAEYRPIIPDAGYAVAVSHALSPLERPQDLRRLARPSSHRALAATASRYARACRRAEKRIRRLVPPTDGAAKAQARFETAVGALAAAFSDLARAAGAEDRQRERAATARVRAGRTALGRARNALAEAGYTVT